MHDTMSSRVASVEAIRSAFPALERRHGDHPVAYFDAPGGTQSPRHVLDALADYYYRHNANTHWNYASSAETDALLAGAREAYADFLNADASEIVFGQNMTTLTYHLSRTLGRDWGPGDEVVVTQLDHQANRAPWHALEVERGITVRTVPMIAPTGEIDWEAFEDLVGERTKLVAFGAASNAVGTVTDVNRAARLARSVGALLFVDAVHYAHHGLIDVKAWDCDALACSAYKFYGPHVGVLYVRRELGESLDPPKLPCSSSEMPEKFETGTLNHEGIVGAGAAVDFLAGLAGDEGTRRDRLAAAFAELHRRGQAQTRRLWDGLQAIPGVTLYGLDPDADRTSTVSFTVEGVDAGEVTRRLSDEHGVFVSHGDFYATGVVEALGLPEDGLVRAGGACYTIDADIDRLIESIRQIAGD